MGQDQAKLVVVDGNEQAPKSEAVSTEHLCLAV